MRPGGALSFAALALLSCPAAAQPADAVSVLTQELKAHVPAQWQVRARWRDGQLLASITPWPYQEAFALWYDPGRLAETLRGLCPGRDEVVWTLLRADQDIILEPTVGGKSGVEARISCRRIESERS